MPEVCRSYEDKMKTVYTFTENERAYVQAAQAELLRRMRAVAEINEVRGNIAMAPDGSGFVEQQS
jgi:flagellar biosynthesis/type III secretory pathway M-ring protein FliF/YscJ